MEDTRYINGKAFLSSKDAAQRFGVSAATIAKRCKAGVLDAQKVHGTWYVRADACPGGTTTKSPATTNKSKPAPSKPVSTNSMQPRVIVTLKKEYVANRATQQLQQTCVPQTVHENTTTASTYTTSPMQWLDILPTRVQALIPSMYTTLCSMGIGALVLVGIFFAGVLPFMSQPLAALSRIDQPMLALAQGATMFQTRIVTKTTELAQQSMATASTGFAALAQQTASLKQEPREKPNTVDARPSMLARAASAVPHLSFREKIIETSQLMAAAFMSLYQFEKINTSIAHSTNSTWGCVFGFGTCPTKDPVPLRGVTVYDIETKRIHCLQVANGQPTSTPGRCAIEDRK